LSSHGPQTSQESTEGGPSTSLHRRLTNASKQSASTPRPDPAPLPKNEGQKKSLAKDNPRLEVPQRLLANEGSLDDSARGAQAYHAAPWAVELPARSAEEGNAGLNLQRRRLVPAMKMPEPTISGGRRRESLLAPTREEPRIKRLLRPEQRQIHRPARSPTASPPTSEPRIPRCAVSMSRALGSSTTPTAAVRLRP